MLILITTLIAHIVFTLTDAYWLFTWLDMPVHFLIGAGLAIVFVKYFKWGMGASVFAVIFLAFGWEYAERLLGFSQALAETFDDASTDMIIGVCGGFIGALYQNSSHGKK